MHSSIPRPLVVGVDFHLAHVGASSTGVPENLARLLVPSRIDLIDLLTYDPDAHVYVAWAFGETIGVAVLQDLALVDSNLTAGREFASLRMQFRKCARIAFLRTLIVTDPFRGLGVEEALRDACRGRATQAGFTIMIERGGDSPFLVVGQLQTGIA